MRVRAPAKVNLFLRIVGRRADGYHLLDSVMAPVSLYDEVEVTAEVTKAKRSHIRVTCDDPTIPADRSNLAHRAAALICRRASLRARVAISLYKQIPAGAGLGGGSSNAAAVLTALNCLLGLKLTFTQLSGLAVRLGADVPFFLAGGACRVRGIGETVTRLPRLPRRWLTLVVPHFSVSTVWAYREFDRLAPDVLADADTAWAPSFEAGRWPKPSAFMNDLERAVLPSHPVLAEQKDRLRLLGDRISLMSGSGSAVFGVFTTRAAAARAAAALSGSGRTYVVRLVDDTDDDAR